MMARNTPYPLTPELILTPSALESLEIDTARALAAWQACEAENERLRAAVINAMWHITGFDAVMQILGAEEIQACFTDPQRAAYERIKNERETTLTTEIGR